MNARLIFKIKRELISKSGKVIFVRMDLFEITGSNEKDYPGGHKFSWIAFDSENPDERVLFDSHPPKGPHFHVDSDLVGVSFQWRTIEEAQEFFISKVTEKFGEFR